MIYPPTPGSARSKACDVRAAPVSPLVHAPEAMMARAVKEQMMIVSMKVPSIATRPWLTGPLVDAAACAMGADPRPASFENTPRATPKRMAAQTAAPAKPPVAAEGVKAWVKIKPKAAGISVTLINKTKVAAPI